MRRCGAFWMSAASQPRCTPHAPQGIYAGMDLTSVVSTLESHWVVLEAELAEIHKDYAAMRAFTRKYGEYWNRSLTTLKKMRMEKENQLKECVKQCACALQPHAQRPCPSCLAGSSSKWSSSTCIFSKAVTSATSSRRSRPPSRRSRTSWHRSCRLRSSHPSLPTLRIRLQCRSVRAGEREPGPESGPQG